MKMSKIEPIALEASGSAFENGVLNRKLIERIGDDHLNGDFFLQKDLAEAVKSEPAVRGLAGASAVYRDGVARLRRAMLTNDPSKTAERQYVEHSENFDRWLTNAAKTVDKARSEARAQIEGLENDIARKLDIKDSSRAAEIRNHVKAMKAGDKLEFVRSAIVRFDRETLGAVLGAPEYLSGLTEKQLIQLRNEYRDICASDLVARVRTINKALDEMDAVSLNVMAVAAKFFPKDSVAEIRARVNRAQSARAEFFDPNVGFQSGQYGR